MFTPKTKQAIYDHAFQKMHDMDPSDAEIADLVATQALNGQGLDAEAHDEIQRLVDQYGFGAVHNEVCFFVPVMEP